MARPSKANPAPRIAPDGIRRPRQARGQARFDAILDGATRLLATYDPGAISIYTLAEETGLSAASIYHFFPDAAHVMLALAERYLTGFLTVFDTPPDPQPASWQALQAARFGAVRAFYDANPAARRLLLGSGISAAIRARDLEVNHALALAAADELNALFVIPPNPHLVDRIGELIAINDALWSLSVHRNGTITDEADEQARRAREAFARTFLPEYTPQREPITPATDRGITAA